MKETIRLSAWFFKAVFVFGLLLPVSLLIIFHNDLEWYYWLLCIIGIIMFLPLVYFSLRLKLIFDYDNKKIIYFAYKKHIIGFDEIKSVQAKTEVRTDLDLTTTTYNYIYLLKTNSDLIRINISLVGFKKTIENIEKTVIGKISRCGKNEVE